jgi:predicted phosphodiesterase
MARVRILHISDLHERAEREKDAWRRRRVLGEAWERHLDDLTRESAIDAVLFTGDAADWGKPAEFCQATEFLQSTLDRLELKSNRLFVIPGNHDVDRSIEPGCWTAFRAAMANTNDLLGVARWMSGGAAPPGFDDQWRARISGRLEAYRQWVCEGLRRPELAGNETTLGYRATLDLPEAGYPIHILGLNTAWLCGDDNDAGKLWILDEQLMRIATDPTGNPLPGLRLLLMHHPFDQMADGAQCRRLLRGYADLVLRGHLHDEEIETWSDPDRSVRQLAAGCLYEGWRGDQWPNACHVIALEGEVRAAKAEVHFRSWSARGHWHDDNGLYEGAKNGRIQWEFAQLAVAAAAAGGAPIAVNPWKPAVPPAFVGRQVLLKKLRGAWDEGRSVSLVGDWRIGKSSILATCFTSLEKSGRPVRLLSGESHEGSSPREFVKAVTGLAAASDPDGAADMLAAWARQERRPGLLPLLLVDECDALVRRFEYRFFERLRGMLDDLCLGVSSRRELDRVFQDAGKGASPFQNRLELHWVGLLEPEASEDLIDRAGAGLPQAARRLVREWAGRHPFFIQLIVRKLLDAREFGQTELEACEEFQAEAYARLRELWGTLAERDQKLLSEAQAIPKPGAAALRRRGLLDDQGRPFGRVLTEWLKDEAV